MEKIANDSTRRRRLVVARRFALGLLLLMTALYVLALYLQHTHSFWTYLMAFCEAAMVGAIADWFAVSALFRHPLGIPIWHTAIIPNSKDDIARNLGAFLEDHLVTEGALRQHLLHAQPAKVLRSILQDPEQATALARGISDAVQRLLLASDDAAVHLFFREQLHQQLMPVDVSRLAAAIVQLLITEQKHQDLLDSLLGEAQRFLQTPENQPKITGFIVNLFQVDNSFYQAAIKLYVPSMLASLAKALERILEDNEHPFRSTFTEWIQRFQQRLQDDPDWQEKLRAFYQRCLESQQFNQLIERLWSRLKEQLCAPSAADNSSTLQRYLCRIIAQIARMIEEKPQLSAQIDNYLVNICCALTRRYRHHVSRFIEAQFSGWSKSDVSERIELAIGRDLQFIRINGTLVGGLVGLLIHTLTIMLK